MESMARSEHLWILGLAAAAIAGSFLLQPSLNGGLLFPFSAVGCDMELPGTCIFRNVTGIPCPGCGLTRSFVHLAHGNFMKALEFHLMGPVLFVLCLLQIPYRLIEYTGVWRTSPIWIKLKRGFGVLIWGVLAGTLMAWTVNLVRFFSTSP
jgi:hypothetical protein